MAGQRSGEPLVTLLVSKLVDGQAFVRGELGLEAASRPNAKQQAPGLAATILL
ncbi:MAG: hypothetical protein ACLPX9_19420 [Rhodomicrobium sp.]